MSKFTPGPWALDRWGAVCHANKQLVVVEGVALSGRSTDETRANARLIAAAPELLDALKYCAAVCAGEALNKSDLINALEKARGAIAKATGETA